MLEELPRALMESGVCLRGHGSLGAVVVTVSEILSWSRSQRARTLRDRTSTLSDPLMNRMRSAFSSSQYR